MEDTKQMRENPELSLEEQDRSRRRKKKVRAAMSFGIMALLLLALFFASVNIGSLKVSLSEMLRGMLGEVSENAATVFDLRFPRIFISMLAGAAVAVSGVLFQAVLKNPLADPGIIGISSGAGFTAVVITAFVPSLFFFTPVFAFLGGVLAFFLVYSLSWKGGFKPSADHPGGRGGERHVFRIVQRPEFHDRGECLRSRRHCKRKYYHEDLGGRGTLLPYVAAGLLLALCFAGRCNILSLEDQTARSLGVNVNALRILISLAAVLLAGISTAVAGAVSFLG